VIPGEQFDTYRYKLRALGNYHEIGQLLTGIASMTRIVAPMGLQLSPSGSPSAAGKAGETGTVMLQASFQIQTYAVKTAPGDQGGNGSAPAKPGRKG
jgi:Tfp pilus assembly protein PilO